MQNEKKPVIIFDTDMDTDCDDAGALAMLIEAHLAGKIELACMIADSVCRYAAPCCEAIADFYGLDIPVGTLYADDYMESEKDIARFSDYRKHTAKCAAEGRDYNRVFSDILGKTDKDYDSAKNVYRKFLSEAEDKSVTVLCVGMLTAISEALDSIPDEISDLSGQELFEKKVSKVITMGNPEKFNDFNWGMDALATKNFFLKCPVPIYISSLGSKVVTGEMLSSVLPKEHLLRRAYEQWLGKENTGRSSWDLIAALFAINPKTLYLKSLKYGNCTYCPETKLTNVEKCENPKCEIIELNCTDEEMKAILNKCMLGDFSDIL